MYFPDSLAIKGIIYRDSKSFIQHHLWKLFSRGLAGCIDLLSPVQTIHFYHSITRHWSIQRSFSEYKLIFFPLNKQPSPSLPWSTPKPINLQCLLHLFAFYKVLQSDALEEAGLLHNNLLPSIYISPLRSQNISIFPGTPSYIHVGL